MDVPSAPIPASEYFESWLPQAFAAAEVPPEILAVDLELGIALYGDGGGEWVFQVVDGKLTVAARSREKASFTLVQSVDDWRGALWEGRGGAIGKQAGALFRPGELAGMQQAAAASDNPMAGLGGAPSPAALAQMQSLDGLIRMVVAGGQGGDWSIGFRLGPGAIPDEPTTTVTITAEDAAAMETGELNPLEAFMAGRIQVAGDMTLMMQMQAISMQVASQQT